jgi:transposase-like protein
MNLPMIIYILTLLNHFADMLKNILVRFKGMDKNMFNLCLKECKFNNRKQNFA